MTSGGASIVALGRAGYVPPRVWGKSGVIGQTHQASASQIRWSQGAMYCSVEMKAPRLVKQVSIPNRTVVKKFRVVRGNWLCDEG